MGALESALARPENQWSYGRRDLPGLAAAYAFGIARNHPFVDGNKRVAFLAMIALPRLKDVFVSPDSEEAAAMILALAAEHIGE
jgi:death-on-curing protein